jgi:HAD superfamily 5'-nucleotidase-like hydrolase
MQSITVLKNHVCFLYGCRNLNQKTFSSETFANIDTLFSLPDAFMYAQLVDFKDSHQDKFPMLKGKSYSQMYKDIRRSVDLCHRDGVIKDKVTEDPARYIESEPGIVDTLKRLKLSGRKVFLLTNSLWEYTNTVMNHITGNTDRERWNLEWLKLFDLVRGVCC